MQYKQPILTMVHTEYANTRLRQILMIVELLHQWYTGLKRQVLSENMVKGKISILKGPDFIQ